MKASIYILDKMLECLREYSPEIQSISSYTTFEELHMDSYDIVDFLMCIERECGVVFTRNAIWEMHCLQDVIDELDTCVKEELSNA